MAGAVVLSGCTTTSGSSVSPSAAPPRSTGTAASSLAKGPGASASSAPASTPAPLSAPTIGALARVPLVQTSAFPSGQAAQFQTEMRALWAGIASGSARMALAAFFPRAAYIQLKAVSNPAADYQDRLLAHFSFDIAAAHRYVSAAGSPAHLLYVALHPANAAWIDPGSCWNRIGYWHLPGARLVYSQGGHVRSIGIASLISWRGMWYVVHLGAVARPSPQGFVDAPSEGQGPFGPPGGC